jgi:hypothetical protein
MRPGTGRLLAGTAFCPCGGGPFRVERVTTQVDHLALLVVGQDLVGRVDVLDSRWCPLVMLFLASKKGDRCR